MIKKYNFLTVFLLAVLIITTTVSVAQTASVSVAQDISIKKLSKTNVNGVVEGNIRINDYDNTLRQINLIFTYIGKKSTTSRFAPQVPEDRFVCSITPDGSYNCIRYNTNKVGVDITNQFKISMDTITLTSRDCAPQISTDSADCDQTTSYNLKLNWKTPTDLYIGFYKVRVEAVDNSGKIASDESKFRSVKRKPILTTSNTESIPSTSSQKPIDTETSGNENSDKIKNGNTIPIEPITLQELVLCQRIFAQIVRGMHNTIYIDTSDSDLSMADLNNDGIISLQDLVVFQQHYMNPGWCRAFFEPKPLTN